MILANIYFLLPCKNYSNKNYVWWKLEKEESSLQHITQSKCFSVDKPNDMTSHICYACGGLRVVSLAVGANFIYNYCYFLLLLFTNQIKIIKYVIFKFISN